MKNVIKIISISLMYIIILGNFMCVNARMDTDINININAIKSNNGIIEKMLGVIQAIGSVLSVVAIIIIGFRYMFASVEGKAEMKGITIYYIIGAVLVFATSNILGIVYDVISSIKLD